MEMLVHDPVIGPRCRHVRDYRGCLQNSRGGNDAHSAAFGGRLFRRLLLMARMLMACVFGVRRSLDT